MTKHIKKVSGLSRREVLVGSAAGAGLVIGYSVLPNAVDSASKAIAAAFLKFLEPMLLYQDHLRLIQQTSNFLYLQHFQML